MSSRCQCRFSGPADTILGSHRDPISSEKCWLDFAVRELSRVAAGKARGQEAVWRSQCKPAWWDCVCPYPWKNPTANPKDSKDALKTKFECLVQHLRKEGQIPEDLMEEITLWEKGRVQEVFLMTSFSSSLGQASNLHSVLGDACRKMEETGITVAPSILTDLQNCLSACVRMISSIKNNVPQANKDSDSKAASCSGRKHPRNESDSDDSSPPCKRSKHSSTVSSHLSSSVSSPSSSAALSPVSSPASDSPKSSTLLSPEQCKLVSKTALQKQLLLKRSKTAAAKLPSVQNFPTPIQVEAKIVPRAKHAQQKKQLVQLNQGSLATAASVPVENLSAIVSDLSFPETSEFKDFLSYDFMENDSGSIEDLGFCDQLLKEIPCSDSLPSHSENIGLASTSVSSLPESPNCPALHQTRTLTLPDPLLGCDSENENLPVPVNPETIADRLLSCESDASVMEGLRIALSPDARDTVLSETEIVTDSDYETCSPISHRSSLDYADLSSPDLEALLNSFQSVNDISLLPEKFS